MEYLMGVPKVLLRFNLIKLLDKRVQLVEKVVGTEKQWVFSH